MSRAGLIDEILEINGVNNREDEVQMDSEC
jgi:hypothetical protein